MQIVWEWKAFQDFANPYELYRVLQLRQQVFIVEQTCVYEDLDDKDSKAQHILGWAEYQGNKTLAAYARLFLPEVDDPIKPISFGRVAVDKRFRGLRLGEQLVAEILKYVEKQPQPGKSMLISAQHYLIAFYKKFGFETVGEVYDEDGILHIDMLRS